MSAALASADEVTAAIENLAAFTAAPDTIVSGPRILQVWAPAVTPRRPDVQCLHERACTARALTVFSVAPELAHLSSAPGWDRARGKPHRAVGSALPARQC